MTHHAKSAGPDGFIPFFFTQKHRVYLSLKLFLLLKILNFTAEAQGAQRKFLFSFASEKKANEKQSLFAPSAPLW
jgi:hypothetical protein